ncbi:hypothetical protein D3OALGB2SA_1877, partial [Olavius algarvensis associated proteobacterium Delta 3]
EMMAASPTNTIGDPSDFGAAAAFLASVQARYITRGPSVQSALLSISGDSNFDAE